MQTVLITGGTGLIGKALTKHLVAGGYKVIILTRKMPESKATISDVSYALWDVSKKTIDLPAVQQSDCIIHLAGAGVVDKKWTGAYKSVIIKSRTESSALLVETLRNNTNKVKTVVSASAIGWYGEDPTPNQIGFVETDASAPGFLGETCRLWEESIAPVENLGIRLVNLRTGIVLSNDGGALAEFKRPVQFGVAGILGTGRQIVSWIHIDDLCRIYSDAIKNQQFSGPYNAVAPNPVSNKNLTIELARQLRGRFYIPAHVPVFVLKLMLGERSEEVLKSTTVSSEKLSRTGFKFLYSDIKNALQNLTR